MPITRFSQRQVYHAPYRAQDRNQSVGRYVVTITPPFYCRKGFLEANVGDASAALAFPCDVLEDSPAEGWVYSDCMGLIFEAPAGSS